MTSTEDERKAAENAQAGLGALTPATARADEIVFALRHASRLATSASAQGLFERFGAQQPARRCVPGGETDQRARARPRFAADAADTVRSAAGLITRRLALPATGAAGAVVFSRVWQVRRGLFQRVKGWLCRTGCPVNSASNALAISTFIKLDENLRRRVNRYNLLKLAGVGDSISAVLEFAIENLVRKENRTRLLDLNVSVEVAIYPKNAIRDQEDARLIRADTIGRLASQGNKRLQPRLVLDDPNIFQIAPDGRPVVLSAWPIEAGVPTVNIATFFARGDLGPVVELVTVPMDYVVEQSESLMNQFVVYCHTITPTLSDEDTNPRGMNYVGITKQGWRKRLNQHLANAKANSPLLFHRALRDHYRLSKVCSHRILTVADNEKSAVDSEEMYVRGTDDQKVLERFDGIEVFASGTLYPKGLNMIPGGYEGLRVLHKMGAFDRVKSINIDQREEHLIRIMQRPEGKSNPLLAALWLDEDYAIKIICGPDGRLKPNQIAQARLMGMLGRQVPDIASAVGARNESQIERLLSGKTYKRIAKQ
jgi:hypothetical protein